MSPRKELTTLDKLTEGLRLLTEAANELEATHPLSLYGTTLRVNEAIARLTPPVEGIKPEVTDDG